MEISHKELRRKESESRILECARAICALFPTGEITFSERPDLRIEAETGPIGIEVTQLFRLPAREEAHHREISLSAEKKFYELPGVPPVFVNAAFLADEQCERENREGWLRLIDRKTGRKKDKMANSLMDFVNRHVQAGRLGTFADREIDGQFHDDTLPTGFEVIHVSTGQPRVPWRSGESANMSLDPGPLYTALCATIMKKNENLLDYRINAPGMPIWLLIYIGPSLSQSVWVPPSIGDWKFAYNFDRVLLFSAEKGRVYDIASSVPR